MGDGSTRDGGTKRRGRTSPQAVSGTAPTLFLPLLPPPSRFPLALAGPHGSNYSTRSTFDWDGLVDKCMISVCSSM